MKSFYSIVIATFIGGVAFAQTSTVKLQGEIAHKKGDVIFIRQGRDVVKEIKCDGKGNFKEVLQVQDGMYLMSDGKEYAQLFLKNGYDLKVKLDAEKFGQSIVFSGKGEVENNFLAQYALENAKYGYEGLLTKDEATFNKMLEDKKAADLKKMSETKLDPLFVEAQTKSIEGNLEGLKRYYGQKMAAAKLNNTPSAPFDFENHKGGKTSLESLKGKYVYIDVWATWCGPCRGELPHLKKLEEKYHGKNIEFVSISVDAEKDHEKWTKFVVEKELQGTQLFADKSFGSDFVKAYGINSIPRFILIDPTGKIINADADRPSNSKLQVQLDGLLN